MKTVGIITEYNPFHQGHIYHIQKAKQYGDVLVAICSGFYSQRGLPSLISRQDKTKLALQNGVDLVLELPACYASQSADYFAKYAIQSLSCLNVDTICFGSETNDIEYLKKYTNELSSITIDPTLSQSLNTSRALDSLGSNDILGIQYIRFCQDHGIEPVCIQRNNDFISATKTRADYFAGKKQFNDQYFLIEQNWQSYYPYLKTFLLMTPTSYLSSLFMVNEGIEFRLKENARKYDDWQTFLNASISKTYTRARIQRTCLFILLQISKEKMQTNASFYGVKVLGFNKKGQQLLKQNKDQPIYTRFGDLPDFLKEVEIKSKALYNSVLTTPLKESEIIRYAG
ncbi:nucleotidyltransferase family protein [Faecalitalea cylindroides]|uniref:nucleotidyltransferase family protein n=1 Tax=Faecalitalea cylindroides TaxID=39483 RepID=UPI00248FA277|nr:nucleotidyltransferase family protein [Faecalitalea cylindroides]